MVQNETNMKFGIKIYMIFNRSGLMYVHLFNKNGQGSMFRW